MLCLRNLTFNGQLVETGFDVELRRVSNVEVADLVGGHPIKRRVLQCHVQTGEQLSLINVYLMLSDLVPCCLKFFSLHNFFTF